MKHFIHLPPSESRQSGMSVNIIQWFLNKTYLDKKAHRGISSIQKKKNKQKKKTVTLWGLRK